MAFANSQSIVACLPFPVNSHAIPISSKSLGGGGYITQVTISKIPYLGPQRKKEEETASQRQARKWGAALVLSSQNMGLLADSSSVLTSAVVAAAAAESSIMLSIHRDSEAEVGDKCR